LLLLAVVALAACNGENDNFKGVAPLYGSRTLTYARALTWATGATLVGSMVSGAFRSTLARAVVIR